MEPMGWGDFLVVFACCAVTMLVCRTVPLFCLLYTSGPPVSRLPAG